MTYSDFCEFRNLQRKISETPPKEGGGGGFKLTGCVTLGNKERALLLRGLPFRVTHEQIQEFFLGYGNIQRADIIIEESNKAGRRTGAALVFFEKSVLA